MQTTGHGLILISLLVDTTVTNNESYATVILQRQTQSRPMTSIAEGNTLSPDIKMKSCRAYEAVTYELMPDFNMQ